MDESNSAPDEPWRGIGGSRYLWCHTAILAAYCLAALFETGAIRLSSTGFHLVHSGFSMFAVVAAPSLIVFPICTFIILMRSNDARNGCVIVFVDGLLDLLHWVAFLPFYM